MFSSSLISHALSRTHEIKMLLEKFLGEKKNGIHPFGYIFGP